VPEGQPGGISHGSSTASWADPAVRRRRPLTIVVLMILVAAVLLAAPATAGAHVTKAHKKALP
jgi:hypothetical protein